MFLNNEEWLCLNNEVPQEIAMVPWENGDYPLVI